MKKISLLLIALFVSLGMRAQPTDTEVTAMSFNIRLDNASDSLNNWKYRKDNAAEMVRYYHPDIVGMQEVVKNQLVDFKARLKDYTALGVGRADGKEKGEFCPIFYKTDKYILLDYGNFGISETPEVIGKKGWDAACERIVTWAILRDNKTGQEIAAFNTHLDHIGSVARREGSKLVLNKIREIAGGRPVILTGDFNGNETSEPYKIITNGLKSAFHSAEVAYGPKWTFHDFGRLPVTDREMIDFIFTSNEVTVKRFRIIADKPEQSYLSDHCPIIATIVITK